MNGASMVEGQCFNGGGTMLCRSRDGALMGEGWCLDGGGTVLCGRLDGV